MASNPSANAVEPGGPRTTGQDAATVRSVERRRAESNGSSGHGDRPDTAPVGSGFGAATTAPRLQRAHMPTDFRITVVGKGGLEAILFGERGERTTPMTGFEDTYVDIVDYIVRITHKIWEEKDLGYIYNTYSANARVTDEHGLKANREQMISESVAAVNAFPDAVLYADDIIWAGDENVGFHTSHRVFTVATNTGYSEFGRPTGRKTASWAIANCVVSRNEIVEEWLLDNSGAIILQLGLDLFDAAREIGNRTPPATLPSIMTAEVERLQGQGKPWVVAEPTGDQFDPDAYLRWALHNLWNWRNISIVDRLYAMNARFHGATEREFYGRGDIKSFYLSMLTMFPDLAYQIDEIYYMGNDDEGYAVSVRWSILGTHRGMGVYGPPTGRRIHAWGISQLTIRNATVVEEWNVFNEFEVLQQLLRDEPVPGARH